MFFKPFYIVLFSLTVLLFASQESNGRDFICYKNKFRENVSKTPLNNAHQNLSDLFVNMDEDDDQTSSNTKHKLFKATVTANNNFKSIKLFVASVNLSDFYFNYCASQKYYNTLRFSKTSISLAICCLRI